MFLKLLRTFILKNEYSTKILLKSKHRHIFANKLQLGNNLFYRQMKFNLQEYHIIKQPFRSKNFSSSKNLQLVLTLFFL